SMQLFSVSFFFQAEDGIRDFHVTGVQTCALPIFVPNQPSPGTPATAGWERSRPRKDKTGTAQRCRARHGSRPNVDQMTVAETPEIGRASCRGRGEPSVAAASTRKKEAKPEVPTAR